MSTMQYSIDWDAKLPPAAQEGMQRAYDHADPDWRVRFDRCIYAAALKSPTVTCDDVLRELEAVSGAPTTHTLSAIGNAMQRATKAPDAILKATEQMVRSTVEHKHGNWRRVYESRVYKP